MTRRNVALILFAAMTIHMIYVVVTTCLQSNLFKEWDTLAQVPWLVATVKDFYQVLIPFCLWTFYKEVSKVGAIVWIVAFITLGSIATSFYVVVKILQLKPDEPLSHIFLKEKQA